MAEKKTKKIVSADTGEVVEAGSRKKTAAAPVGNAAGLRWGAVGLWVLAIAFEVVAYLMLIGTINLTFMPCLWRLIIALVLDLAFAQFRVNYGIAILYGLVGSLAGVFGDLCFSVIKRQTGIKDYGNLIPGHGGILDRFDSMMVVGPLAEILLILLPLAV